jgi:ribosomal-protein-alanine N-acetyltransferase
LNIHLETERFLIRNIETYDAEAMFEMDSNPKVHKYLGNKPITKIEEAKEIIKNIREQYEKFGIGRWAIATKDTNEFVGWTGFKREEKLRPDRVYIDLGYRLREKFWRQGIATETARACLEYGFETLNYDEIFACADVDNLASNKILKNIGFQYIEDFEFEGIKIHWYGINAQEWD